MDNVVNVIHYKQLLHYSLQNLVCISMQFFLYYKCFRKITIIVLDYFETKMYIQITVSKQVFAQHKLNSYMSIIGTVIYSL